jgi:tRNA (Thr-GGU) A37 N-methylase
MTTFEVKAIGRVESSLTDLESAPRQADEGAPEAWLVFEPEMLEALSSLQPGDEVLVLTWLDWGGTLLPAPGSSQSL